MLAEDFSSLVFFAFYQDDDERSERDLLAFLETDQPTLTPHVARQEQEVNDICQRAQIDRDTLKELLMTQAY